MQPSTGFSEETPLPEFEIRVREITGNPLYQPPEATRFQPLEKDQVIERGAHIQSGDGTVELVLAGSLYVFIDRETKIIVDELQEDFKTRGLLFAREEYTLRQIEMELINGSLKARTRFHDNVATDFRLKTLTSVAALKGTTIYCESDFDGHTTVKVLDGHLNFHNRFQPDEKQLLGPGFQSSLHPDKTKPAKPSSLSREEIQELYDFRKDASTRLLMPPFTQKLALNNNPFASKNKQSTITHPYSRPDTLMITGQARSRETKAEISKVEVFIEGRKQQPRGVDNWRLPFTIQPPPEGRKMDLRGEIIVHDDLGSTARAHPFRITLFHPEEEKVIPEDLLSGIVPVQVEKIGKMEYEQIQFPLQINNLDLRRLPWEGHRDTGVLAYPEGIRIYGSVDVDTPVEGVAYSLDDGFEWHRADGENNWQLTIPDQLIRDRKKFNVRVVAWTTDGYIGSDQTIGPFVYREIELPYPFEFETGEISPAINSVGRKKSPQFPLKINNADLAGEKLTVSGRVEADTAIEGVVYRINGEEWQTPRGLENWQFDLPSGRSEVFDIEVIAWTEDNLISKPLTATIKFEYIEPTLPRDYNRTEMDFKVSSIASFPIDEIQFPFHTYRSDAEANGLAIRGTIAVDTPLEGMAMSLDGGKSWDRIEPARDWLFHLPHRSPRTYDNIRVLAWTVDGKISQPLKVETIEHSRMTADAALRDKFAGLWEAFKTRNTRRFLENLDEDFIFRDDESGAYKELNEFRWFLKDLFREIRNLDVTYSVKNIKSGPEFAVLDCHLEWRGVFNNPDRPFIMFSRETSFDFSRQANGIFSLNSMRNFPPVVFLFNKRAIRIPDFGGISLEDLTVQNSTTGADLLAEVTTPDLTANYAALGLGGDIIDGGLMELRATRFSDVRQISSLSPRYRRNQTISRNNFYAVNIEDNRGNPATALIKVVAIRPDHIEIQIVSARPAPGERTRSITNYREVAPFE
ncbi:MAG: hypothetical protein ACLFN5_04315 [bacterium]